VPRSDLGGPAQQIEQADTEQARETLVDHLERRHATTNDANLVRKVVVARLARSQRRIGLDGAAVHTM